MRYDYVVALKRDPAHKTDLVSFLLLIFSILSFSYVQIRHGFRGFLTVALLILLGGLIINLFRLSLKKQVHFRYWLFVAGLCWLGMPDFQWMFLAFALFAVLETQAKYPLEIAFDPQGIVLNSLIKKKFPWESLQSVVLKDGLLTLDFKNNRLFQKEVMDDDEPDADEDEFNDYCRGKIVNLP